ncbi:MAG: LacI family transcriptional regulator [Bifidobacteriaceae bacterium]|jgi:DNA-binding LacI/PurR family transcriptional regulator|nr:LacI family transcriptional regulator [Bifidobacteriaceae bacterium]
MDRTSPARRPTIRAVAERAGVSKSLVSLVLNDSPKVSPASREAVLAAIADLGYTPNAQARALSSERTRNIALIVNDMRNPWFVEAVDSMNSALTALGLRMLIADQRLDLHVGETVARAFVEMSVDGAILVGPLVKTPALVDLIGRAPAVSVFGSRPWRGVAVDAFVTDDAGGVGLAMEHLLGLGHVRIAYIAVSGAGAGDIRRPAYEAGMREAGLASHIAVEVEDGSEDGGFRAAVRLLTHPDKPTAVIAYNDRVAIGALSAARDLRIDVPDECSIVGYGNTSLARSRAIFLTTVDQAPAMAGRQAVATLVERMRTPAKPSTTTLVAPTLVVRLTTGKCTEHTSG